MALGYSRCRPVGSQWPAAFTRARDDGAEGPPDGSDMGSASLAWPPPDGPGPAVHRPRFPSASTRSPIRGTSSGSGILRRSPQRTRVPPWRARTTVRCPTHGRRPARRTPGWAASPRRRVGCRRSPSLVTSGRSTATVAATSTSCAVRALIPKVRFNKFRGAAAVTCCAHAAGPPTQAHVTRTPSCLAAAATSCSWASRSCAQPGRRPQSIT